MAESRMTLADCVGKSAAEVPVHAEESPNTPFPLRGDLWQQNCVLGQIIKNVERKTKAGLIIADTRETQDKPHAMQIMKISADVVPPGQHGHSPMLYRLQQAFDPEATGNVINGPFVTYKMGCATEWSFPEGEDRIDWAVVDARHLIMSYIPMEVKKSGIVPVPAIVPA